MSEEIIPRIIHYCWFGKNQLSDLHLRCIQSWQALLPGFRIIEWNETNFDINSNLYIKQAYAAKKWAFVSDYARLKVLYEHGGIYLDTDVEVLKSLVPFLKCGFFSGFEGNGKIPTGVMGAAKRNQYVGYLLEYYHQRAFIQDNGQQDLTTNVEIITNMTKVKYDISFNDTFQIVEPDIYLYPSDWFCAKDFFSGKIFLTPNTHTIHHFSGSWQGKWKKKIRHLLIAIFGVKTIQSLYQFKNKIREKVYRK